MRSHGQARTRNIVSRKAKTWDKRNLRSLFAIIAVLFAVTGLSSCAGVTSASSTKAQTDVTDPPATVGPFTPNATSFSFGSVLVGSSTSIPVTVTNFGTTSVTVSAANVTGTGYSITGIGAGETIAGGSNTIFNATFAPTSAGSANGTITITSNATDSPISISLSGTAAQTQAQLVISPASVNFGVVAIGASNSQTIMLTNTGNATLTISAASVSGAGYSASGLNAGETIAAGQNATFTAKFAPTGAGSPAGSISITSNAPTSPSTIALSGTAAQGTLSANPSSISFGSILVNSSSTIPVTLTNTGTASVTISAASASGTGYSISGLGAGEMIAAGSNTIFNVTFAPTSAGSPSGTVTITSNATNSSLSMVLSGTATQTQAQLAINPTSVNFGNVAVGSNNPQTITLSNTGNASLTISAASASGTGFSISGLAVGTTINAGQNTTFTATFTPTSGGSPAGNISISSNAPNSPATIALTGTGTQPLISANPTSANLGSVVVGSSNSQGIKLTNTGNATLTFSSVTTTGNGFSITGLSTSTTIAAGGSVTFDAVYTPASASGAVNGSVLLADNGSPAQLTIPLSGTGVAANTQLGASSPSLSFGNVNLNTSSQMTTTLTNTGNTNVTITGVSVTGAGFSTSGVSSGLTLQPTQTATLTVTFDPTATGTVSGAGVTITSNAPTMQIPLSGAGVQYSVLLTWTASSSTDVTGYYAYRSTTQGSGYVKLNPSSPTSTLQFTDNGIDANATYYYVVTAVDSSDVESAYSTPATAVIP
jgi:HYDIN/CFA65/VesB family protein/centrosomal CEP192-like protein/ASPM-SPD-2-Hydin domain-containing protein